MQLIDGRVVLSPSDLMRFQGCAHATALDRAKLLGAELQPVEDDEDAKLLQAHGHAHEQRFLEEVRTRGKVIEIPRDAVSFAKACARTQAALREGPAYIYQAAFAGGAWTGYADFLERVERPSDLGPFSYEVVDTKLKRTPDPKHVLQLALYADLLKAAQGCAPEQVHVVLGDGVRASFRLADYAAYVNRLRERLESFIDAPTPTRPEPVAACALCRWREHCAKQWEEEDSLCLVAGITRGQRRKLEAAGVVTMAQLAALDRRIPKLAEATATKLRIQARLQHARRQSAPPSFELKPVEPGLGLARLPQPDPGDLFFDIEGDPYVSGGLEYLFGLLRSDDGAYRALWAHDPDGERHAVGEIIHGFAAHLRRNPGAHIYHYGAYELSALKRLSSRYGVAENVLDDLLRGERFVDLYRIVQQGIVASEPGYSLKDLEVFYMPPRSAAVTAGGDSIVAYERWRETREDAILEEIRTYNETDCRSTKGLRDWLVSQVRPKTMPWFVAAPPRQDQEEPSKGDALEAERSELWARIEPEARRLGPELAKLLFELAFFHRREDKPSWWQMFDRAGRDSEDLIEDLESLAGLEAAGAAWPEAHSQARRYRFPEQETKLRTGERARTRETQKTVQILGLDHARREAIVKFGPTAGEPPDRLDLIPDGPLKNDVLVAATRRFIEDEIREGGRYPALSDLLRKRPPRIRGLKPGEAVIAAGELIPEIISAAQRLAGGCLPIQGPPGTGKTYVASQVAIALLRAGKRVGAASHSHKAIDNLLREIANRARETGYPLQAIKKNSGDEDEGIDDLIAVTTNNGDPRLTTWPLVAGTAWLFSRPEHDRQFDYLIIDEAGQVSLANVIAMGTAARNLILVGDPMQLSQPLQGAHPEGTGCSALDHLFGGRATVPPDRGVFLPISRRMHPLVCRSVSEIVYEGRLHSDAGAARQLIDTEGTELPAAGISFVELEHEGNSQSSPEEVEQLAAVFGALLGRRFVDREGRARAMTLDDLLVVAPYNAQVNRLKERLPAGARVGTVDRFQGQEAPVCLISMTTSGMDELPRGVEFLFSRNRLNVAVSRAQALAIVFASRRLLDVPCRTVEQMGLVNALCALRDHARGSERGAAPWPELTRN